MKTFLIIMEKRQNSMILIKIMLNNGKSYFINEKEKGIALVSDICNAFRYQSVLEFKVTWKVRNIMKEPIYYDVDYSFNKEDVVIFEAIDEWTRVKKEFKLEDIELKLDIKKLFVDNITFRSLLKCAIGYNHYVYDKDNNYLEEIDYDKAFKITYLRRGLMYTISSYDNWGSRYKEHSWNKAFELHHKCMMNPIIQQLYLLDGDSCDRYNIYKR